MLCKDTCTCTVTLERNLSFVITKTLQFLIISFYTMFIPQHLGNACHILICSLIVCLIKINRKVAISDIQCKHMYVHVCVLSPTQTQTYQHMYIVHEPKLAVTNWSYSYMLHNYP